MQYVFLIGRILFSSIFIIRAFTHFSPEAIRHSANAGMPMPELLTPLAGLILLLGGFSILLGFKAKWGAWLLVLFLIPTTLLMHRFWEMNDQYPSIMEKLCFLKNISMIGAALMLTYTGSGPFSLDKKKSR